MEKMTTSKSSIREITATSQKITINSLQMSEISLEELNQIKGSGVGSGGTGFGRATLICDF